MDQDDCLSTDDATKTPQTQDTGTESSAGSVPDKPDKAGMPVFQPELRPQGEPQRS